MIKIENNEKRDLKELCENHFKAIRPSVNSAFKAVSSLKKCQKDFIETNLYDIITGLPADLEKIHVDYKSHCAQHRCIHFNKGLHKVFDYKKFIRKTTLPYNAYHLASALDIRVCPYCNRQYTFTVVTSEGQFTRPELDHFLCQSQFPMFGLSFYNLIPSCKICNSSLKRDKKFKLDTHIHPYVRGFADDVSFTYRPNDSAAALGFNDNMEVILQKKTNLVDEKQIDNNIKVFRLIETYHGHSDIVKDIVRKFYMTDGRYLDTLLESFPQIGSMDELYRLAFGTYLNDKLFDQRVLSKLTRDIVKSLDFTFPTTIP
ncbi:MAG TPA: hypothetical protein VIM55_11595 [Mucilaginibacter sp.]